MATDPVPVQLYRLQLPISKSSKSIPSRSQDAKPLPFWSTPGFDDEPDCSSSNNEKVKKPPVQKSLCRRRFHSGTRDCGGGDYPDEEPDYSLWVRRHINRREQSEETLSRPTYGDFVNRVLIPVDVDKKHSNRNCTADRLQVSATQASHTPTERTDKPHVEHAFMERRSKTGDRFRYVSTEQLSSVEAENKTKKPQLSDHSKLEINTISSQDKSVKNVRSDGFSNKVYRVPIEGKAAMRKFQYCDVTTDARERPEVSKCIESQLKVVSSAFHGCTQKMDACSVPNDIMSQNISTVKQDNTPEVTNYQLTGTSFGIAGEAKRATINDKTIPMCTISSTKENMYTPKPPPKPPQTSSRASAVISRLQRRICSNDYPDGICHYLELASSQGLDTTLIGSAYDSDDEDATTLWLNPTTSARGERTEDTVKEKSSSVCKDGLWASSVTSKSKSKYRVAPNIRPPSCFNGSTSTSTNRQINPSYKSTPKVKPPSCDNQGAPRHGSSYRQNYLSYRNASKTQSPSCENVDGQETISNISQAFTKTKNDLNMRPMSCANSSAPSSTTRQGLFYSRNAPKTRPPSCENVSKPSSSNHQVFSDSRNPSKMHSPSFEGIRTASGKISPNAISAIGTANTCSNMVTCQNTKHFTANESSFCNPYTSLEGKKVCNKIYQECEKEESRANDNGEPESKPLPTPINKDPAHNKPRFWAARKSEALTEKRSVFSKCSGEYKTVLCGMSREKTLSSTLETDAVIISSKEQTTAKSKTQVEQNKHAPEIHTPHCTKKPLEALTQDKTSEPHCSLIIEECISTAQTHEKPVNDTSRCSKNIFHDVKSATKPISESIKNKKRLTKRIDLKRSISERASEFGKNELSLVDYLAHLQMVAYGKHDHVISNVNNNMNKKTHDVAERNTTKNSSEDASSNEVNITYVTESFDNMMNEVRENSKQDIQSDKFNLSALQCRKIPAENRTPISSSPTPEIDHTDGSSETSLSQNTQKEVPVCDSLTTDSGDSLTAEAKDNNDDYFWSSDAKRRFSYDWSRPTGFARGKIFSRSLFAFQNKNSSARDYYIASEKKRLIANKTRQMKAQTKRKKTENVGKRISMCVSRLSNSKGSGETKQKSGDNSNLITPGENDRQVINRNGEKVEKVIEYEWVSRPVDASDMNEGVSILERCPVVRYNVIPSLPDEEPAKKRKAQTLAKRNTTSHCSGKFPLNRGRESHCIRIVSSRNGEVKNWNRAQCSNVNICLEVSSGLDKKTQPRAKSHDQYSTSIDTRDLTETHLKLALKKIRQHRRKAHNVTNDKWYHGISSAPQTQKPLSNSDLPSLVQINRASRAPKAPQSGSMIVKGKGCSKQTSNNICDDLNPHSEIPDVKSDTDLSLDMQGHDRKMSSDVLSCDAVVRVDENTGDSRLWLIKDSMIEVVDDSKYSTREPHVLEINEHRQEMNSNVLWDKNRLPKKNSKEDKTLDEVCGYLYGAQIRESLPPPVCMTPWRNTKTKSDKRTTSSNMTPKKETTPPAAREHLLNVEHQITTGHARSKSTPLERIQRPKTRPKRVVNVVRRFYRKPSASRSDTERGLNATISFSDLINISSRCRSVKEMLNAHSTPCGFDKEHNSEKGKTMKSSSLQSKNPGAGDSTTVTKDASSPHMTDALIVSQFQPPKDSSYVPYSIRPIFVPPHNPTQPIPMEDASNLEPIRSALHELECVAMPPQPPCTPVQSEYSSTSVFSDNCTNKRRSYHVLTPSRPFSSNSSTALATPSTSYSCSNSSGKTLRVDTRQSSRAKIQCDEYVLSSDSDESLVSRHYFIDKFAPKAEMRTMVSEVRDDECQMIGLIDGHVSTVAYQEESHTPGLCMQFSHSDTANLKYTESENNLTSSTDDRFNDLKPDSINSSNIFGNNDEEFHKPTSLDQSESPGVHLHQHHSQQNENDSAFIAKSLNGNKDANVTSKCFKSVNQSKAFTHTEQNSLEICDIARTGECANATLVTPPNNDISSCASRHVTLDQTSATDEITETDLSTQEQDKDVEGLVENRYLDKTTVTGYRAQKESYAKLASLLRQSHNRDENSDDRDYNCPKQNQENCKQTENKNSISSNQRQNKYNTICNENKDSVPSTQHSDREDTFETEDQTILKQRRNKVDAIENKTRSSSKQHRHRGDNTDKKDYFLSKKRTHCNDTMENEERFSSTQRDTRPRTIENKDYVSLKQHRNNSDPVEVEYHGLIKRCQNKGDTIEEKERVLRQRRRNRDYAIEGEEHILLQRRQNKGYASNDEHLVLHKQFNMGDEFQKVHANRKQYLNRYDTTDTRYDVDATYKHHNNRGDTIENELYTRHKDRRNRSETGDIKESVPSDFDRMMKKDLRRRRRLKFLAKQCIKALSLETQKISDDKRLSQSCGSTQHTTRDISKNTTQIYADPCKPWWEREIKSICRDRRQADSKTELPDVTSSRKLVCDVIAQ